MYIKDISNGMYFGSKWELKFDNPIEVYDYLSIEAFNLVTNYTLTHNKNEEVINNTYELVVKMQKIISKYTNKCFDYDVKDNKLYKKVQEAVVKMNDLISEYMDPLTHLKGE